MDRDAISDALISLDRIVAGLSVPVREGTAEAVDPDAFRTVLAEALAEIHHTITQACGLEDPGMKCDCLCHDVEPSGYRHGSHTPDLCVCFGTDFQGEQ